MLEYAEGGAGRVRRFRGDILYAPVVLERGVTEDRELYEWFLSGELRDGAIVLLSGMGKEVTRWEFRGGWPCSWDGPDLDAGFTQVALERLEIVHEGLRWVER